MTFALDAGCAVAREPSGVAAYCDSLIAALTRAAPEDRFLLAYRANRILRAPPPPANARRVLLEDFALPWWSRRANLFHGLNQRLPKGRFAAAVTTFHDLFVMTGEYSEASFRERFASIARDAAQRSNRLIAVSAFTASQVRQLLEFPSDRLHVVHHGVVPPPEVPAAELRAFRERLGLERPFILHVGAVQTRKNVARLVEAFEGLDQDVDLVLAGADGYGAAAIHQRIDASRAGARVHRLGYVDSAARARLYRSAAVLAFPSLDEGFGLPVLEAMAAGLPTVTSNRSALPEVAGDAALLVDPLDAAHIQAALARALDDEGLRADLIRKGRARAARFTWEKAAQETLAVYRAGP